ncbi:AI-2E family transporter [Mucilaginibacter ginkgonis]|uniref:AI-2E family transporter n=1 Tax=Mucilaginibacter ginkgonis TaxID=2682091 RepID=A0A6I4INN7_9SPHI|nr:AI-2E family transporter [Mucilaginibacter ginkgonis]QQL48596.1 AI-2E family transporter [Mucilaginibacter ginkgonis]
MVLKEYPYYLKVTVILFGLILFIHILGALGDVLVPLAFALLVAILLNPLCNKLNSYKIPRPVAIIIALVIAILGVAAILYFLSAQIISFSSSFPELQKKFGDITQQVENWVHTNFGIDAERQVAFIKSTLSNSKAFFGRTLSTVLGTLGLIFLIPVYTFMILYYKNLILNFLYEVFSEKNSKQVAEILKETKSAVQSYIVGLLVEMVIVAIMNSVALLLLGVKYAILLGVIGAILNMLPYIGGLIAIALPILIATVTKDGYSTQFGILIAYLVIQFIDNNIVFPRVVSFKVQINALISIVIVLLGNELWGIAGMFLSVPFVAVIKIIFDRIDELKPWGKLLGDTIPTRPLGRNFLRPKAKAAA